MHLKATLIKCTKLFFGDIRRAIVSCIVSSLILAGGGVVTFAKTARDWLIQTSNTPTPLWVTISLILLGCSYIYIKVAKFQSKLNHQDQSNKSPPPQYSEYQPTPGVFVYVSKTSPNREWYCKHCADVENTQSTLQMVHHSAAGKEYQCHKCKFGFRILSKE